MSLTTTSSVLQCQQGRASEHLRNGPNGYSAPGQDRPLWSSPELQRYVIERFEVLPTRVQYTARPFCRIIVIVKQLKCQKYRQRPAFVVYRDNLTRSTPVSMSTMSRLHPDCVQDAQHETRCRTA